jgi:hypothetical protein
MTASLKAVSFRSGRRRAKSRDFMAEAPSQHRKPLVCLNFELGYHDGRTAKHAAFMGGADFAPWHGVDAPQEKLTRLKAPAADLRRSPRTATR